MRGRDGGGGDDDSPAAPNVSLSDAENMSSRSALIRSDAIWWPLLHSDLRASHREAFGAEAIRTVQLQYEEPVGNGLNAYRNRIVQKSGDDVLEEHRESLHTANWDKSRGFASSRFDSSRVVSRTASNEELLFSKSGDERRREEPNISAK